MRGQGFDVDAISCEDDASGFGDRNDERVDSRAGFRASTKLGCSACRELADRGVDDAHLQETVRVDVAPGIAVQ